MNLLKNLLVVLWVKQTINEESDEFEHSWFFLIFFPDNIATVLFGPYSGVEKSDYHLLHVWLHSRNVTQFPHFPGEFLHFPRHSLSLKRDLTGV